MAKIHEAFIMEYLKNKVKTCLISAELIKIVQHEFPECSYDNIRKIISNAAKKGLIKSSEPMTFGNNQYAYFSSDKKFGYGLAKGNIKKYKPVLHRVLVGLFLNNGIMTWEEAYKLSGCIIDDSANSLTMQSLINDLRHLGMAQSASMEGLNYILLTRLEQSDAEMFARLRLRLQEEAALLSNAITWLKKVNIVDSRVVLFKGEANQYQGISMNNTFWDATSFTTAVGYQEYRQTEKTIVVVDFLYNRTYQEYDLQGFQSRIEMSIHSTANGKRRMLPIVFARSFSPKAMAMIKKSGMLAFDFDSVFGETAAGIIHEHIRIKNSAEVDLEAIESVLEKIDDSNMGGNYANIKGDLFEYVMRPVFEKIWPAAKIQHSVKAFGMEYDYVIEADTEYIVIELKGYNENSFIKLGAYNKKRNKPQRDTVKWFLSYMFPKIKDEYEKNPLKRKVTFCYITTAKFEKDAIEVLKRKNASREKPEAIDCYYDGKNLLDLLKKHALSKELEVLKRYYLKSALENA